MSATATTPRTVTLELMRGSRRRHRKERLVRVFFLSAAALGLVISLAIVLALVEQAIRWLFDIDLGWLWTEGWFPRADEFDLLTILAGTVMIAVIAMLVATPLGLGAAAYLSEYATSRMRRTLKPILETLASIPRPASWLTVASARVRVSVHGERSDRPNVNSQIGAT